MTWNTLTNLSTGQVVTETHMDNIRENIEHLGAMLFGANAVSALTAGSQLLYATGTYTGDGAATKTISGLGFTPRAVLAYKRSATQPVVVLKVDVESTFAMVFSHNVYIIDMIVSLGSGQFVVGDGTGFVGVGGVGSDQHLNVNAVSYAYIAFR